MAAENKEKEAVKKKKEREKMYALGTEDNEADQPDTIMKGKIMSTYERTRDIERNFKEARKLVDPKDDPVFGIQEGNRAKSQKSTRKKGTMARLSAKDIHQTEDSAYKMDVIEEGQEQEWEGKILQPIGDVTADINRYFSTGPDE